MTILILHGIGGHAGIHWQQWLADELEKHGHTVIMPNLSDSAHPDRQTWLSEIKQALADIDLSELTIVAHSLGVASALDFLEFSSAPIKALISVSGFALDYDAELNSYFMREKTIKFDAVRAHVGAATVFYGDNDPYVAQEALKALATALEVQPVVIHGGGHLNTEAGYTKFPRLLSSNDIQELLNATNIS